MTRTRSPLLVAEPSFLEGMARVVDLCGHLNEYNRSENPEQADRLALRSDWRAIGADIAGVMLAELTAVVRR